MTHAATGYTVAKVAHGGNGGSEPELQTRRRAGNRNVVGSTPTVATVSREKPDTDDYDPFASETIEQASRERIMRELHEEPDDDQPYRR